MQSSFLNQLNINQLKVFESVYRLRSMTLAAQELHLTQSGISQHIKKLEADIGFPLFIRNKLELFATPEAELLSASCQKAFSEINTALERLARPAPGDFEGTVRIGVPTEFGNNVMIPYLAEWSRKNPKVKFDLIYGYGPHLIELLELGNIDLALIDSMKPQKNLESRMIYRENLSLVASTEYLRQKKFSLRTPREKIAQLVELDYIEYEHKESILRLWLQAHYGKKNLPLNIKVWAMNVQGVAACIRAGLGVGVLPNHVIQKLIVEGLGIYVFKGTKEGLQNEISLVWVRAKPYSRAIEDLKRFIVKT